MKRIISIFLIVCLLTGNLAPAVYAQDVQSNATVQTDDITVEGTNGFGNLLSAEIVEAQEAQAESYEGGYTVTDLVIEGNTATVTYDALEDVNLIVALYTEDGMQLLSSANATVSAEETEATVTFAGEMPEYFLARAYMVDIVDCTPLSHAYETPMYTQTMQELLNSTVDDYDPELVVNFDDDPTTNFAVYKEGTVIVEEVEGVNIITTNDDENLLYVIENADETFTSLQPGDVVSYFYGEEDLLLCKVGSVTVNGTTVTIHGEADLAVEEVFDYVKVEQDGDTSDFTSTDIDPDDGIELIDETEAAPVLYGSDDNDVTIDKKFEYTIDKLELGDEDDSKITAEISGTFSIGLKLKVSFYSAKDYVFMRFKLDYSLEFAVTAEGKITLPLENFCYLVLLRTSLFRVTLSPTFIFELSGAVDFTAKFSGTFGFSKESGRDIINLNTNPRTEMQIEMKSTITASLDFQPEFSIIHEKIAAIVLSVPIKGVLEGQLMDLNVPSVEPFADVDEFRHECVSCIEGKCYWMISVDFEVNVLKWKETLKIGLYKSPETKFYYSLDYQTGGIGECPYKLYLVLFEVLSESTENEKTEYSPVEDAVVNADGLVMHTNEEGVCCGYFSEGTIQVSVSAEEVNDSLPLKVKGTGQKMKIILNADEMQFGYFVDDYATEETVDASASVASGTCGDQVNWTLFGSGALYIYGSGAMNNYSSASQVPWHDYRSKISLVRVSGDVTSVCNYAFQDCSNLYSVYLCDTIQSIGSYAFNGCGFTWFSIPESVETLGGSCFSSCRNLEEIEIPGGISEIPASAFYYCTSLSEVDLPPTVTSIGSSAFNYCSALTTVSPLYSVTSIGESAFANCKALKDISFWGELWYIGANAFSGCAALTGIELPDTVTTLGISSNSYYDQYKTAGTFSNCTSLLTVRLGNGLKEIPASVFAGCSALESVTIGNNVTAIGYQAFARCKALTSLTIPASVTKIETEAFTYSGLKEIWFLGNAPTFTSDYSGTCQCFSGVNATAYYPEDNETWTSDVRKNYKGTITWTPYSSLASGTLDTGVTWELKSWGEMIISGKGSIYDYSGWTTTTDVPWHSYRERITSLTVQEGINGIGPRAFSDCSNLTRISLPSTIISISDYAFSGCPITSIEIPDAVTSIGISSFQGTSLTEITIPDSVRKIGKQAFRYCYELETVHIGQGVTEIDVGVFEDCSALKTVTGMVNVEIIGEYAFVRNELLSSIPLTNQLGVIDMYAFMNCDSLTAVHIPDSVTSVYGSAFYSCNALKNVTMGSGITTLGSGAFSSCDGLTQLELGENLEIIEDECFAYCSSLERVVIPETVNDIGSGAFYSCRALSEILFEGDAPDFGGSNVFSYVTANVYYPQENGTWTEEVKISYGGILKWIPYTTDENGNISANEAQAITVSAQSMEKTSGNAPTLDAIYGGEYASEDTGEYILRTASFSGLVPGEQYLLLAMVSIDTDNPVEPENLLYIDQAAAEADGTLTFTYVQRVTTDPSYVVACGAATKTLADATITFPEMTADGELHAVNPTVTYEGNTLQEGRDYEITGTVSYTEAGTYVCYIRGIHNYTGTMKCTYIVKEAAAPEEPTTPTEPEKPTEPENPDVPTDPEDPDVPTDPTDPEPEEPKLEGIIRMAGADRIETSLMLADQLKEVLGVEKFSAVIVASALNFPDALTGSYLAAVKSAPILLTYDAVHGKIQEYIRQNLASGGTVYILGDSGVIPSSFETGLQGGSFRCVRLAGETRFETNLEILREAGVSADQPVLIATAVNFADSLSASAAGLPIVLVYGSLRPDQKEFLESTSKNFVIIGGTSAVSTDLENELKAIGTVERLAGAGRYETSVMVARKFISNPDDVVLAYARNFPDGLCGGPLAYALGAPLILTDNYDPSEADKYVDGITSGVIAGSDGLISDDSAREIFDLASDAVIKMK